MTIKNQKITRRLRVKKRIRGALQGSLERPRLAVYKSNTSMYVQLINDDKGETIIGGTLKKFNIEKNTVDGARLLGEKIAEKALEKGIRTIVFDRSGYIYHGKLKALAEGAREKGLKF